MEIVLIRHTSVDVPSGTCYGQTDVALRASFGEEAQQVKEHLSHYGPMDVVFSSPLSRCVRLADACGYPMKQLDARLMELNFGAWEMQRYDEIADPRLQAWYADYLHVAPTGGESFQEQKQRVFSFFEELRNRSYQRVAVFTHGGVIGCALLWAGRITEDDLFQHIPPFGGIVSLT